MSNRRKWWQLMSRKRSYGSWQLCWGSFASRSSLFSQDKKHRMLLQVRQLQRQRRHRQRPKLPLLRFRQFPIISGLIM